MPAIRRLPAAGVLAIAVAITGCDSAGSPSSQSSPSPSRLNLRAGVQTISFLSFGFQGSSQFPLCTPAGVPAGGTLVATRVMLERDGADWVARSGSAANGTLEIRLRESGVSAAQGEGVTGTVRGSAIDLGQEQRAAADVRINISGQGGAAVLDGVVDRTAFLASGRIDGSISFADSANASAACTAAQWLMQPVSGIFATAGMSLMEPRW